MAIGNYNPNLSGVVQAMTGKKKLTPTLPSNYGFNELANYEEERRNIFSNNLTDQLAQRRKQLSQSLTDQGQQLFAAANPRILEDLNSRGLFSSPSAVNTSQSNALRDIGLANQQYLNDFDTQSVSAELQSQQDALDAGLDLRRGGLEAQRADSQAAREEALARDLAKTQIKNSLTNSLIGAGGSIGAGLLAGRLGGGTGTGGGSALGRLLGTGTGAGTGFGSTAIANTAAGAPASSLFPGGLGAVGTNAPASGIGLGGAAAIGGAGLGAMALSGAAENKYGTLGGVLANPIGYQLNKAKQLITNPKQTISSIGNSLGFGAGKTANGDDIAQGSWFVKNSENELTQLKQAVASGEITQDQYLEYARPVVANVVKTVEGLASRGSKYATPINQIWAQFQQAGLARPGANGWEAV